jgi:hypothetical protein
MSYPYIVIKIENMDLPVCYKWYIKQKNRIKVTVFY